MITPKNAVDIGTLILKSRKIELEMAGDNIDQQIGVRAATYRMLQEFWYEGITSKVKEQFDYRFELFYDRCRYHAEH